MSIARHHADWHPSTRTYVEEKQIVDNRFFLEHDCVMTISDNDGLPMSRQATPECGKKLHFKGVLLGFELVAGNRPLQDGHGTPGNWHQRR